MSYRLEFILPGLPKNVTNNMVHWRTKHAESKKWKSAVGIACRSGGDGSPEGMKAFREANLPLKKARLTLTRYSSSAPDYDGLVASFKHVVDGLVEAVLIENDTMAIIGAPTYLWEKAKPKFGFIRVVVEEVV